METANLKLRLGDSTVQWVNNPTLTEFCFGMIGRADIEGSKSNVAMNAWLPQASSLLPGGYLPSCPHRGHWPVGGHHVSGGSSPYLKPRKGPTPLRALNRSALRRGSRLGCGLSLFYGLLLYPAQGGPAGALLQPVVP